MQAIKSIPDISDAGVFWFPCTKPLDAPVHVVFGNNPPYDWPMPTLGDLVDYREGTSKSIGPIVCDSRADCGRVWIDGYLFHRSEFIQLFVDPAINHLRNYNPPTTFRFTH